MYGWMYVYFINNVCHMKLCMYVCMWRCGGVREGGRGEVGKWGGCGSVGAWGVWGRGECDGVGVWGCVYVCIA